MHPCQIEKVILIRRGQLSPDRRPGQKHRLLIKIITMIVHTIQMSILTLVPEETLSFERKPGQNHKLLVKTSTRMPCHTPVTLRRIHSAQKSTRLRTFSVRVAFGLEQQCESRGILSRGPKPDLWNDSPASFVREAVRMEQQCEARSTRGPNPTILRAV
jgi:hypothetical protein